MTRPLSTVASQGSAPPRARRTQQPGPSASSGVYSATDPLEGGVLATWSMEAEEVNSTLSLACQRASDLLLHATDREAQSLRRRRSLGACSCGGMGWIDGYGVASTCGADFTMDSAISMSRSRLSPPDTCISIPSYTSSRYAGFA